MFLDNKYTKTYFSIIEKHSTIEGERHHIIPKSLGGSNSASNIVTVSPRTHFILHKLLCRMVSQEKHRRSMYYAIFQMMNRKICYFTSRDYEKVRLSIKSIMKEHNPMFNTDVSSKFRKTRPEQSEVASKRNNTYWSSRARPLRTFNCPVCDTEVVTRIPSKTTCSKSCSATLQHRNK